MRFIPQQKARADRLKEYASTVSTHNKEKLVVKKARSAPAPVIKERMIDSKRAAVSFKVSSFLQFL